MSLQVSSVARLEDILGPAIEFLSAPADLFARRRIVVPTAGAKAWLAAELASRLGATGKRDGVVANVDICFPGALAALLEPRRIQVDDPWDVDRLTFTVLDVLAERTDIDLPFERSREPLLTARRIAGRFDRYHVRRPAMILRWEQGAAVVNPVAADVVRDGERETHALDKADRWQFDVWRAVRERIGEPSPPSRASTAAAVEVEPLLVAGLQALSLQQVLCLEKLGARTDCPVHVLLVHPSPPLFRRWSTALPEPSLGVPRERKPPELPQDLEPLVATWLHGARETQMMLASQSIHQSPPPEVSFAGPATGLLHGLKRSILTADKPQRLPPDVAHDGSFVVHRCHSLSRQAEVLHDAILHAFHDLPGLEPHDVVIASPCLEKLAPHLEAAFDREITGGQGRTVRLPLMIADRGLHEISGAAKLLGDLLSLVGSRCSVEQLRSVATHELVRNHLGIDEDMIDCWDRLIDRTRIHWGFDATHRLREHFPEAAAAAHSWQAGLERMILGGTLPDGDPRPELGDVVPLEDVATGDIAAVATLIRVFDVVAALDSSAAVPRATAEWCTRVEEAMFDLCGAENPAVTEPLREVRRLRAAASPRPVPFGDIRQILADALTAKTGRQPLRTGAITVTSMVPLRDVPFRVVCVAGYDDGAVGGGEVEADDLVSRQQLLGDIDPRIDARRSLLDCLLAAGDRLLITCNGISLRNNATLPFVTPLAELVDFAVRHGVTRPDPQKPSDIEISHPRHAISRRNFLPGKVQEGVVWSHDASALSASKVMGCPRPTQASRVAGAPALPLIELAMLEEMVRDPLGLYLRKSLGISTWRDDGGSVPAVFPLALSTKDKRTLARQLLDLLTSGASDDEAVRETRWLEAVQQAGLLPFGIYGHGALDEIRQLAHGLRDGARDPKKPVPLTGFETVPVRVSLPACELVGHLADVHRPESLLVDVHVETCDRDDWGLPLHTAALRLLAAHAGGEQPQHAVVFGRHDKWQVGGPGPVHQVRQVCLADTLRSPAAAMARLDHLCGLVPQALAAPRGRFGTAAHVAISNRVGGRQQFERYVGRPGYPDRAEATVYGLAPRFDDALGEGSPELRFHEELQQLLNPVWQAKGRRYVLS